MGLGKYRWKMIGQVSKSTAIMPRHYRRMSNAVMKADDPRLAPLKYHLDYLLELGEVRATRVVATLSDGGVQGHANRKDTVDMVYLPISMGFRNCSKRYMHSLGYKIRASQMEHSLLMASLMVSPVIMATFPIWHTTICGRGSILN